MKIILSVSILFITFVVSAFPSSDPIMQDQRRDIKTDSVIKNPAYDADLAEKLGADAYGMKNFVLVILKTGSNVTDDKAFITECFRG
ncbi:MAG TPA: hypothetical protein DDZ57_06280, partial [Porphyromonadaceae bacterium]|nr:hypothetical protein [Porphyromonadaceae bacterium]